MILLSIFVIAVSPALTLAWDNERTHIDLSQTAAINSKIGTSNYLKTIGLEETLEQKIKFNDKLKTLAEWLQEGSDLEDAGNNWHAIIGQARFNNHFYNPLKPWNEAGLDDLIVKTIPNPIPPFVPPFTTVAYPVSGEAAIQWAQDSEKQETALEGNWTWGKVRALYYKALTSRTDTERQAYFAQTFRGLGHQMHLLQDMSVPAHVRNDGHPEEAIQDMLIKQNLPAGDYYFEMWAKYNAPDIKKMTQQFTNPAVDLTKNPGGLSPITQFYDTDKYVHGGTPDTSPTWGLSEYTNANFVSADTIFTETFDKADRHYFPYPSYDPQCYQIVETVDAATSKKKRYLSKTCQGEQVTHFAAAGPLFPYLWPLYRGSLKLDETTHREYSEKLVPRAVGYSAGLLNYFFRGQIRLVSDANNPGQYIIQNNSEENMRGIFSLYYDDVRGNRNIIKQNLGYGLMSIDAKMASDPVTFDMPSDGKEPGKFILVFQGTIGSESGAVAGYITTRILEITPPSQFIYSMVDANEATPQFKVVTVKVRKPTAEIMQNGTLQAIAKYKKTTDDPNFLFSVSTPQSGISLGSDAQEFSFDFTNNPIPMDATDLYLEIVFKGTIGTEQGATAIGIKDISEPTPLSIFNNMDRICIYGKWYVTGTPEAYNALPVSANWDYWTHDLKDLYFKVSPVDAPNDASTNNYTFYTPSIKSGALYQVFILSDYDFVYSSYGAMAGADPKDDFVHDAAIKKAKAWGAGIRNQTAYSYDPAFCSDNGSIAPCTVIETSDYYLMRGVKMWWQGSFVLDGVTYPNFTDPGYIQCSWDALKP